MKKSSTPQQLAIDISRRSTCNVQVGAVIQDRSGRIVSWGWNNPGRDGKGQCAEAMAVERANPKRLKGSTIYIAGFRRRNKQIVYAKPCLSCLFFIGNYELNWKFLDKTNKWERC